MIDDFHDDDPVFCHSNGFDFQIYFRCDKLLSDTELLREFDLGNYQRSPSRRYFDDEHVVIADSGAWKVLAEGVPLFLDLMPSTRVKVERLAGIYDIFLLSADDYDYEFAFYEGGKIKRKLLVSSCWGLTPSVLESGEPLDGEAKLRNCGDAAYIPFLFKIAEKAGVNTQWENMRVYGPPSHSNQNAE